MFNCLNTKPLLLLSCLFLSGALVFSSSASASSIWQFDSTQSNFVSQASPESLDYDSTSTGGFSYLDDSKSDRTWLLEYRQQGQEYQSILGFQSGRLAVSMLRGQAEDRLSLAGDYQGVDPYLFHGGFRQSMNYHGVAMDYRAFGSTHMQFGQAKIVAQGLKERSASYAQVSSDLGFVRFTELQRENKSLGYGFDIGTSFGNKSLAFQRISLDDNKELNRVRFMFEPNSAQQIWLDLGQQSNALFEQKNDYSLMLSFKTLIGQKPIALAHNAEVVKEEEKAKSNGLRRGLFIGGAIAGAAALSSSGSEDQDDLARFSTQNSAARSKLNAVNPKSVRENAEYGGYVFINSDGSYSATPEVKGDIDSVLLPAPNTVTLYGGERATASYHTHAAFDPRYDNENFSPQDLSSDRALGVDGYLGTPAGQFKYFNVRTGQITTLGRIAN